VLNDIALAACLARYKLNANAVDASENLTASLWSFGNVKVLTREPQSVTALLYATYNANGNSAMPVQVCQTLTRCDRLRSLSERPSHEPLTSV
jgi:hypothetical protein